MSASIFGLQFGSHPGETPKQNLAVKSGYADVKEFNFCKKNQNSKEKLFPYPMELELPVSDLSMSINLNEFVATRRKKKTIDENGRIIAGGKKPRFGENVNPQHTNGFPFVVSNMATSYVDTYELVKLYGVHDYYELDSDTQRALIRKNWDIIGIALTQCDLTSDNTDNGNSARKTLGRVDFAIQSAGTSTVRNGGHLPIAAFRPVIFDAILPSEIINNRTLADQSGLAKDKVIVGTYELRADHFISAVSTKMFFKEVEDSDDPLSLFAWKNVIGNLTHRYVDVDCKQTVYAELFNFVMEAMMFASQNSALQANLVEVSKNKDKKGRYIGYTSDYGIASKAATIKEIARFLANSGQLNRLFTSFFRLETDIRERFIGYSDTNAAPFGEFDIYLKGM